MTTLQLKACQSMKNHFNLCITDYDKHIKNFCNPYFPKAISLVPMDKKNNIVKFDYYKNFDHH